MLELQTDLLEWLQQRKKGRQDIGFHGAGPWGDEVELPGTAGCVQINLGCFWNFWQCDEPYYYRFYQLSKDKFDKHKPKEIRWESVPVKESVSWSLAWVYGQPGLPLKPHQGSARYIKR